MATVNSTASASNKNKTIHRKVFCTTHSLLSLPSRIYEYGEILMCCSENTVQGCTVEGKKGEMEMFNQIEI